MKLGFFDSGIGGLSVYRLARKALPEADLIYYADTDNVPYGEKSESEVTRLADEAACFLVDKGAGAIVLACNTATSAAAGYLREKLNIPVIGMEPAVKKAVEEHPDGRILASATPLTCRGDKLRRLIDRVDSEGRVDTLPLPGLVRLAEEGNFSPEAVKPYLEKAFSPFDLTKYSAIVLGCTHFLYFTDSFRRLLPENVSIVHGNDGTVNQLKRIIGGSCPGNSREEYYFSGRPAGNAELSKIKLLLKRLEELEEYDA
ncbi:MAG: glutamate racemase [Oscillospiraceae bacterium]|nr:glutamate racemase [Oscillospiraceae bacterium]